MEHVNASAEWGRQLPGELVERWPRDEEGQLEAPVYLCHRKGLDMDDAMLISRMESYGIPCLRQYPTRSAGSPLRHPAIHRSADPGDG